MTADTQSPLGRAMELHREGQIPEAASAYAAILAVTPHDADALHFLGLVTFQRGDSAGGIALIRQSLDCEPQNAHAWNNLGNLLLRDSKEEDAVDAYLQAITLDIELAEAWTNLGTCIERCRDPESAVSLFQRVIESDPGLVPAYDVLGRLLRGMGRPDAAAKTYRRWVELEPDRPTARHLLAAATGDCIPVRASDDYVVELFDAFASDFDQRLARLDYQAPQLVCDAVRKNVIGLEKLGNVLDAGCGTGLCGPLLRPLVTTLVGVDLSAGMLAKAAARSVYDRLVVSELSAYMNAQLNQFDLVVSADTLCYFGDLQEPLAAASACLKAGGLLVFTVEALGHSAVEGTPHRLMSHGRYAHSRRYVCDILQFAGFEVLAAELATLRMELQHGVNGLVVSARKIGYSESCGRRPLP